MIVLGEDVLIAPSVFITASDYVVVAGRPVVHQERNVRDVVLEDGVRLRTVVARVIIAEGAEVPAVVPSPTDANALPKTTALPHGP